MKDISEDNIFQNCLRQIEKKQGWGTSDSWTTSDFENLSKQITECTGTYLSIVTLKRLWGKVNYNSKPSVSTLNCLAQYISFENWRIYTQSQANNQLEEYLKVEKTNISLTNKRSLLLFLFVTTIVSGFIYLIFQNKHLQKKRFAFRSKTTISEGVPNSVVFNYDASQADDGDVVMIQQSWDKKLRKIVSPNENIHTSTYYYPGYFKAKLVVDNKVVRQHRLLIKSSGWLALAEQENKPVYFEKSQFIGDKKMSLSEEQLKQKNIKIEPKTPWVSFFNVGSIDSLFSDNFVFHTQVRNDFNTGVGICQFVDIILLFEGGALEIPLSNIGCVGKLNFNTGAGKKVDPTTLGVHWNNWVDIHLKMKGQNGELHINNQLAYPIKYNFGKKRIVGLRYRFQGAGSINFVNFSTLDGKVLFSDNFEYQ